MPQESHWINHPVHSACPVHARQVFADKALLITPATGKELAALAAKPENEIDFSDIRATTGKDWQGAVRGKFYRPIKQQLTVRIDGNVLGWLKNHGKGYQSRLNDILRAAMLDQVRHRR